MSRHACGRGRWLRRGGRMLVIAFLEMRGGRGAHAQSIRDVRGATVRVRLVDASTEQPLANVAVDLWRDTGVRCLRAPCPASVKDWSGHSDGQGVVVVPGAIARDLVTVETPSFIGHFVEDASRDDRGAWVIGLLQKTPPASAPVPIELIDDRTTRPVARSRVRLEFRGRTGARDSLDLFTNTLGFIVVPSSVVSTSRDETWVRVRGFERIRIEFGDATRRRLILLRR